MRLATAILALLFFLPAPARSEGPPIRLQRDVAHQRVWILRRDAVYAYDSRTSRLIRRITLPGWVLAASEYACPPDLAVAPSGQVLVTTNVIPFVWSIDPASLASRRHELLPDADRDQDFGFSMLAFSGDDVFAYSAGGGSLWRLDLKAGRAHKLRASPSLRTTCRATAD